MNTFVTEGTSFKNKNFSEIESKKNFFTNLISICERMSETHRNMISLGERNTLISLSLESDIRRAAKKTIKKIKDGSLNDEDISKTASELINSVSGKRYYIVKKNREEHVSSLINQLNELIVFFQENSTFFMSKKFFRPLDYFYDILEYLSEYNGGNREADKIIFLSGKLIKDIKNYISEHCYNC